MKHILLRIQGIFWASALVGSGVLVAEPPDTTLLRERIKPKAGTLGIKTTGKKARLSMVEGARDKKVYSREIVAQRFGGERRIELETQTLTKQLETPGSLVKELPPEAQRKAGKLAQRSPMEQRRMELETPALESEKDPETATEKATSALLRMTEREKEAVKLAAIEAMGVVKSPSATFHLKESLRDEKPQVKRAAAEALAKMGEPVGLETLHAALEEEEVTTRVEAIRALGRVGRRTSVPSLRRQLTSREEGVSAEAAIALAKMGDAKGINVLRRMLNSDSFDDRFRAAVALADADDRAGLELLKKCLTGVHADVRVQAVRALGIIGSKEIMPLLEKAMKTDPDSRVRIAASESILKIRRKER